ncbi:MAG: bacterioferritin-associated ferredoxin [Minwuia sp.]|uniref:(2Fe-2S)-binding protein n=1 Tax=Minwuia sp. TaxID=2493630 RepID=UPI003A8A0E5E
MYVCICNALSDRQVSGAIESGAVRDAHDLHPALSCRVQCGRCLPTIADMLDETLNHSPGHTAIAAE